MDVQVAGMAAAGNPFSAAAPSAEVSIKERDLNQPPPPSEAERPAEEPREAVALANAVAAFFDTRLSFSYDDRVNRVIVKVMEGDPEKVIRQIPAEEMIEMVARFRDDFRGLVFDHKG